jgi:hypothetical protein
LKEQCNASSGVWLQQRWYYPLLVQNVLAEPAWLSRMQRNDLRGLTPLFYGHITPYGKFQLNMEERLNIE